MVGRSKIGGRGAHSNARLRLALRCKPPRALLQEGWEHSLSPEDCLMLPTLAGESVLELPALEHKPVNDL
jgi:hypothetical protein